VTAAEPAARPPDLAGLGAIRRPADTAPGEAIEGLAQQFEALLIQMMLKSMRQALPGGGVSSGAQTAFSHGMLDSQLALTLSRQGGLGLAAMLQAQLSRTLPQSPSPATAEGAPALAAANGLPRTATAAPPAADRAPATRPQPTAAADPAPRPGANAAAAAAPAPPFESPTQFVAALWDAARASAAQLGVAPELLIAQAAHETGWGRAIPRLPDGRSSHNLFGIKAGSSWDGQRVVQSTVEVVDGVAVREQAAFRAYDSFAEACADYAALVTTSPRYAAALARSDSPAGYLTELQAGGYATDPHYADRVLAVLDGPTLRQSLAALKDPPSRPI
jgi:flagellar protein FlgJ